MADQQAWANRVAFAFLAASAGVQALQQAMKDAPDITSKSWAPNINLGNWNYLPLALVSIGVLAWLYQKLSIGKDAHKITAPSASADLVQREIPTPPAPPTSTSERIFLDPAVKYSDLIGSLHGKTDIQKNALCRPHIGKWMRVSGIFNDVSEIRNGNCLHL